MSHKKIKWTMFVIAAVGNFIAMLDATTVNLALYPMSVDLHVTMSQIQWVMIAYMLVLTVFLPFFGKLGDIFPKNKLYALGFSIFALGAFLNTTAPTFGLLVTYRCIEAIGASIMLSNAQAIIAGIFKKERRGKALGLNGCIVAIGGMSGPALGGILINAFGWHSVFIPCIPVAIMGAYYSWKMLPHAIKTKRENFKFDYKGFLYFTISLFALLLAISEGHTWGWSSVKIITLGIVTLVFGGLFYFRDHKINYPLINFSLFAIKPFTFGNLAVMTSYMAMYTNSILLPFFLQEILKYNPLVTGLLILPYSVTLSVTAPISGRLSGKFGSRYLTLAGPVVFISALILFCMYDKNVQMWQIIFASGIMGIGNGLFQSPSNNAIMTSVKKEEFGIASGILALSRNMGNILGVAVTITLFETFRNFYTEAGKLYDSAFLISYRLTMCFGILFGIACFIFAFIAYRKEKIS
ncbi:TPA: MFS transporter [Candidatus Scatenecus faecavium]|uniref:MFS transporter n=1 Tax=Candidatus Scatenecus faecavium TaxID=2840915 RepID=A0A9D1FVH4_9BACT|nr:MFS transporter [Candidatus Scatenecus faecavium]